MRQSEFSLIPLLYFLPKLVNYNYDYFYILLIPSILYVSCYSLLQVMSAYGNIIMKTPSKIITVLIYIVLVGIGIYGCTKVKVGIDVKELLESGSQYSTYITEKDIHFPTASFPVSVVLQDSFDYSLNETQQQFRYLDNFVKKSKYFKSNTYNSITDFLSWTQRRNKTHTGVDFYPHFREFLSKNLYCLPYLKFSTSHADFVNTGNGTLIASMISIYPNDNPIWTYQQSVMREIRGELNDIKKRTGYLFIPVSFYWVYIELLEVVETLIARNLGICAVIIMIVTLPYVLHPAIALLMLVMFGSTVVLLFALISACNIDLNGVPAIIIIMSIGFTVDYMAHIAHTYVVATQSTPEKRMIHSLKTIGRSVVKGGMTILI